MAQHPYLGFAILSDVRAFLEQAAWQGEVSSAIAEVLVASGTTGDRYRRIVGGLGDLLRAASGKVDSCIDDMSASIIGPAERAAWIDAAIQLGETLVSSSLNHLDSLEHQQGCDPEDCCHTTPWLFRIGPDLWGTQLRSAGTPPDSVSKAFAADYLGVSPQMVGELLAAGQLQVHPAARDRVATLTMARLVSLQTIPPEGLDRS